ncbi:MAG: DUF3575 domain-containing protein [Bacteroidales bacterium]|nr:DUF3575 domain-containing protein [Bacteroidales bacterium]
MKYSYLIILFFPIILFGQQSKGFLVKTMMFQDIFYQNPNILIEKRLYKNFSIEFLGSLRNGAVTLSSGEGPPLPKFYDCQGFTLGLSARYYFIKNKTSPNSWYVSGLMRYNDVYMKNVGFHIGVHGFSREVNVNRSGPELGFTLGRQLLIGKYITTEFYCGMGTYLQFYDEEYISGIISDLRQNEVFFTFRPYLGWTIGFFIPMNKKSHQVDSD